MLKSMTRGQLAVLALTGAAFILYLLMGLLRHWSYLTLLSDLGVFDQAAWATLHGDFMLNSFLFPEKTINWLGLHFNLILLAFVPLYAIAPWPEWFALAQAAAIALAAWPLFRLALLWFGSERVAFYWALVYLVNPFVLNAAAWDFHPVTLAAPCIAWALLALEQRRRGQFLACCVMLLLIQEQLGLTVFGLGLLWGLRRHEWRFAIAVALLGVAHAALVLGVLMPALSPTGQLLMASAGEGQLSRYSWLGGSATEILRTALTQPLWMMQTVLLKMGGGLYLFFLLLPLLFLPLLAPLWWLPGLADLAANLLSANPMPRGVIAYHSIALLPVLVVAAMRGACRLNGWHPGFMDAGRWRLLLITTAVLAWVAAPLPLPGMLNAWQPIDLRWLPEDTPRQLRQLIGDEASVSAQHNIGSHFSQRRMVRLFDGDPQGAEYVVLWLDTPTSALLPANPAYLATLAHHLAMTPADYLVAVRRLLAEDGHGYGIVRWQQPWLLLRRDASSDAQALAAVRRRLDELAATWPAAEGE